MIRNNQNGRRRGRGGARPPQAGGGPSGNYNGGNNRVDVRQRGNATQLLEKYKSMARDATQNGDRVQAEFYMQYADHYYRVLNEFRARDPQPAPRNTYDDEDEQGYASTVGQNYAPATAYADDGDDDGDEDDAPRREGQPQAYERQNGDRQSSDRQNADRQNGNRNTADRQRTYNGQRETQPQREPTPQRDAQPQREQQAYREQQQPQREQQAYRGNGRSNDADQRPRDDGRYNGETRSNGDARSSGDARPERSAAPRVSEAYRRDEDTDLRTVVPVETAAVVPVPVEEPMGSIPGLPGPATLPGVDAAPDTVPVAADVPAPRKRGRPRKVVVSEDSADV